MTTKITPDETPEYRASLAESQQLLARGKRRNRPMKNAQLAPPEGGQPPMQPQGQAAPPVVPETKTPGGFNPADSAQMNTPTEPLMNPPAPMTQQSQMTTPADPAAPATPPAPMTPEAQANDGLEDFLEEAADKPATTADGMGVKPDMGGNLGPAKYASVYGHLRARGSKSGLEVYDPTTKRAILEIPLKATVVADNVKLRQAAISVLSHVAVHGLSRTAERCRGKHHTADSVVDYAIRAMNPAPDAEPVDSQAKGDTDKADKAAPPKNDSQKDGETDRKENPPARDVPGLGGKTAQVEDENLEGLQKEMEEKQAKAKAAADAGDEEAAAGLYDEAAKCAAKYAAAYTKKNSRKTASPSGGIQDSGETSTKDLPPPPASTAMDSTKNPQDTMKEDRKTPDSDVLSDALNNMLNMEHAAMKNAQMVPPTPPTDEAAPVAQVDPAAPPAAPLDGVEASLEEIAENYRIFYANKARKDAADNARRFASKFLRAMRIAIRRAALNIEDNTLKAAAYDVLTTERRLSATEDFVPLDARTAQFCIEEAMNMHAMMQYFDGLTRRATKLMASPVEILAQMEEDLDVQSPVMPDVMPDDALEEVIGQEMLPDDPMADPMAQMDAPMPPADPMAPQAQGAPPPMDPMAPQAQGAPPMGQQEPAGMDPIARVAARVRADALRGSSAPASAPAAPSGRVDASSIRAALGMTRSAGLASSYNRLADDYLSASLFSLDLPHT